jgi:hypothetical protein
LAGVGGVMLLQSSRSFTLSGEIVLSGDSFGASKNCWGTGALSDITDGATITVTDGGGATIALGQLTAGDLSSGGTCVFNFSVADVPSGKGFYGVEIAHRGIVRFPEAQVTAGHLQLAVK